MLARPRTRLVSILVAGPALFALAAVTPLWNLDSVGYAGLARSWLGQGEREVHVGVYGDLQVAAPARGAKEISASTGYRQTLAADSFTFSRQLPLYKNKPLYIALTAGTTALGGNSLRAPFLVSAASFGVLGMIVVLWCTAILGQAKGLLFAACLLLSPVVREIGQIATPDALASALALGASYLLVHKQDWKLSTVLLALSILCRPYQLFLALALVFWARSLFPQRYIAALIGFMMAVIALFVAIWSG